RDPNEHQTSDGHRLLPRYTPQSRIAAERSTYQEQLQDQKRKKKNSRQQEESDQIIRRHNGKGKYQNSEKAQSSGGVHRRGACCCFFQQYHYIPYQQKRRCDLLVLCRKNGIPGVKEKHALCCPGGRRGLFKGGPRGWIEESKGLCQRTGEWSGIRHSYPAQFGDRGDRDHRCHPTSAQRL